MTTKETEVLKASHRSVSRDAALSCSQTVSLAVRGEKLYANDAARYRILLVSTKDDVAR